MNRSGEVITKEYLPRKCPMCYSEEMENVKGEVGDWVRSFRCKRCDSLIEFSEGDKMGGQYDTITILEDNFNPKQP